MVGAGLGAVVGGLAGYVGHGKPERRGLAAGVGAVGRYPFKEIGSYGT